MMVNSEKERVSLLFMKALVSAGSMDAVSQQMASHPQYLESFLRTQHYILHMDGPLPLPYRHYIAIMVSEWAADSANLTSCTLYKSKVPLMLMSESVVSSCSSICLWDFFPSSRLQHDITAPTWCIFTQPSFWGWAVTLCGCTVWRQHPLAFVSWTTLTRCWPTNRGSLPALTSRYGSRSIFSVIGIISLSYKSLESLACWLANGMRKESLTMTQFLSVVSRRCWSRASSAGRWLSWYRPWWSWPTVTHSAASCSDARQTQTWSPSPNPPTAPRQPFASSMLPMATPTCLSRPPIPQNT